MKQALQHSSTAVVTPLPTSSSDNEALVVQSLDDNSQRTQPLSLPQFVLQYMTCTMSWKFIFISVFLIDLQPIRCKQKYTQKLLNHHREGWLPAAKSR